MKDFSNTRRGSALLVVLGMMAFMLFSGLAFSVYMRQSRLPTSFLRRTVATRQLAKAALAEAIEEIDQALGNDPHPGIRSTEKSFSEDTLDNFWSHRVFVGLGSTTDSEKKSSNSSKSTQYYPALVDSSKTVPTLTLEGLAYLPPNLINEARYYSQRTPTAKWHSFWFDSGRYAYTAIDVSDYLDVNRIQMKYPRAACAGRRLSFSHIFEDGAEHESAGSGAQEWESLMGQYRSIKEDGTITFNQCPFVSMADFNIAFGQSRFSIENPFYNIINGKPPYGSNISEDENDPTAEKYRNMNFVTDGWFPLPSDIDTSEANALKDPFNGTDMESTLDFDKVIRATKEGQGLRKRLCLLGMAQLWDYLDTDDIPLSLAIPTLERTPMVVSINPEQPTGSDAPSIMFSREPGTESEATDLKTEEKLFKRRTDSFKLMFSGRRLLFKASAAYPFRSHGIDKGQYTLDGRAIVFLSTDGSDVTLRPNGGNEGFELEKKSFQESYFSSANGVASFKLKSQEGGINVASEFSDSKSVEQHVVERTLTGDVSDLSNGPIFLSVTYEWPYMEKKVVGEKEEWVETGIVPENEGATYLGTSGKATFGCDFMPLASNGATDSAFKSGNIRGLLTSGSPRNLRINVAVWVRIVNDDGKTVDLVPACLTDDKELNGLSESKLARNIAGSGTPLMRFNVSTTIPFSLDGIKDKATYPIEISNQKVVVNDPRYNHVPENWYTTNDDWAKETENMLGKDNRDSDIYMATSDQGYFQSVYELAFLPRLTPLTATDDSDADDKMSDPQMGYYSSDFGTKTSFGDKFGTAKDVNVMWRTYRCFNDAEEAVEFEKMAKQTGDTGMKVNPYAGASIGSSEGDTHVLMAAFANTPHDWRAACDDPYDTTLKGASGNASTFNAKHAWNKYCSTEGGKLCWDHLQSVADALYEDVRDSQVRADWKSENSNSKFQRELWSFAFDRLGWSSDERRLLTDGDQLESEDGPLYGVDKKFLYGFWHECFATRQQLFLIFVRAEPMMMGGGVSGQVPPQLGARAVALVWRDPTETQQRSSSKEETTNTLYNPHRTRILFYHQFD